MKKDLMDRILEKKIDFVEYSFNENEIEGNDYQETLKQIHGVPKLYRGKEQGVHYYGFRFDGNIFYLCLDNRTNCKKYIIYNFSKEKMVPSEIEFDVLHSIVNSKLINAKKKLNSIHMIQNMFVINWIVLLAGVIISCLLYMFGLVKLDVVSIFVTYVALILALEDSYVVLAKRFQSKIRRIEMLFSVLWMIFLEIISYLLVICSVFTDQIFLTLGDVPTILGIVTTIGVLLIRKDAFSKV